MKSPLNEEQQKKLLEISKLSPEKQKEEWLKLLKTLNKEQIEFLKGQQQKCLFCGIAKKEIKSFIVYEDESVMAVLDINPANKGHVILFPLNHAETLQDLQDTNHIFDVAGKLNKAIIKGLGVKGTNVFIANGLVAGQMIPHFIIHIIPRFENDGVNFLWDAKKISEKEMEDTAKLIKNNVEEQTVETKKIELGTSKVIYDQIDRLP